MNSPNNINFPSDITDDFTDLGTITWYRVLHKNEKYGRPEGPIFSKRYRAKEYVDNNEELSYDDIKEHSKTADIKDIGECVGDPLDKVSNKLKNIDNATKDDKKAVYEAISSTYRILDNLEKSLTEEDTDIEEPMVEKGERDDSWKCYTKHKDR